jgi:DNA gyrase subunit A
MAPRKTANKTHEELADFSQIAKDVFPISLEEEMEQSFLAYSYLTIEERSIPDARDGMKPVQRRIMYTMHEGGNTPDKQHVKSAKIVGSCMGTYHPHGDSAIYDAMVRLAQDFTLMTPLVDGRGNFGDRPGAGAASSRYTEARLSKEALLMTSELRERPVDFVPNYDQTTDQPAVLPVQFPFMTVNGATGIAVGFATNMAPHNPAEVIDATRWLLTHPNADLEKLMTFVPGPDFPTGCIVIGQDGIKEAYETGKGKVTIRAPYRIESLGRGRHTIVFYELPYEVNSEKIMEQIKAAKNTGKLQGIADAKDLTDRRNGIRFVVETKTGVNPEALVLALYKNSDLEVGFSFNNIALVNGRPTLLGLKEQLEIFIDHRIDVVTRRTQHRKDKRDARLHLIEGLLKALANIDEVIKIIRAASDATVAQEKLMKRFKIDEIQADYILAIPLRRLTKFDQIELNEEKIKLNEEVKTLEAILNDDKVLRGVIADELTAVKKQLDQPRRSVLLDGNLAEHMEEAKKAIATASVEVADEPCKVFLTRSGAFIRSTKDKVTGAVSEALTSTRSKFLVVTNKGNAFRIDALHVGEKATPASAVLPTKLASGEKVIAVTPVALPEGSTGGLAIGTRNGTVKITAPQWPKTIDEFSVIGLADNDEILNARWIENPAEVDFVFVSNDTSTLRFEASKVRPQGLSGGGMAGIKLAEGAEAIAFGIVVGEEREKAVVVTHTGKTGKVSLLSLFAHKGRATAGMRSQRLVRGEEKLEFATVGFEPALYGSDGKVIPLPAIDPRRDGSGKPFELPTK